MQIYISPVLNSLSSIVILFSIGNLGYYQWDDEKNRLLMREMSSCRCLYSKSASQEGRGARGQFWLEIATSHNYEDFASMAIMTKYNN